MGLLVTFSTQRVMARFWALGALFLSSLVLFGEACNYQCIPKEHCEEEAAILGFNHPAHRTTICRSSEICCKVSRKQTYTNEPPARCLLYESPNGGLESQPCGKSNSKEYMKRFITEYQVTPGEYPWVVAILKKGVYLAGGSLIAPGVVLTAAHRVKFELKDDIVVRAGEWDFNSNTEEFQFEERQVEKIVWHERFDFQSGSNNLALLFLKSKFQLKEHIRTICLPTPKTSFEGQRCIVAGWGKTNITDPNHSTVLNKVTLPIINRNKCEQQLKLTKLGWSYQLPQGMICAGGELNQDACIDDGGSPLFCSIGDRDKDIYMQVGIVNWGISCGLENVPATYTDVAMFREWIDENLLDFNYN